MIWPTTTVILALIFRKDVKALLHKTDSAELRLWKLRIKVRTARDGIKRRAKERGKSDAAAIPAPRSRVILDEYEAAYEELGLAVMASLDSYDLRHDGDSSWSAVFADAASSGRYDDELGDVVKMLVQMRSEARRLGESQLNEVDASEYRALVGEAVTAIRQYR